MSLPPSPPPSFAAPPPSDPAVPPLLPPAGEAAPKPGPLAQLLVLLLSVCLGLFLVDAAMALLDDSLNLFADLWWLTLLRTAVFTMVLFVSFVVYVLMGLTPMIPKRLFLPVVLFNPLVSLLILILMIYYYNHIKGICWAFSICQVAVALVVLWRVRGNLGLGWPLVPAARLKALRFSWTNLLVFLFLNAFLLFPAVVGYLVACASLAVNHYSDGFVSLRPSGFTVQARKYVRADGKAVHLVPMAHIGEAEFYHTVSSSFPTNSMVLMEGVTDYSGLLTNRLTYERAAKSLGLAEQHEEFHPVRVDVVMADVDVKQFRTKTIGFINLMMLVHTKGFSPPNLLKILSFSPPPGFERELFDDLLNKRNQHLITELKAHLPESDTFVVPWGAAHMPGLSKEVQAAGFRLAETQDYTVIGFGVGKQKSQRPRKGRAG